MPGGNVRFTAISVEQAHNLLALDEYRINHIELERLAL